MSTLLKFLKLLDCPSVLLFINGVDVRRQESRGEALIVVSLWFYYSNAFSDNAVWFAFHRRGRTMRLTECV